MKNKNMLLYFVSLFVFILVLSGSKGCNAVGIVSKAKAIADGTNDIMFGRDTKVKREEEQYKKYYRIGYNEGYSKGLRDSNRNNSYNPRPERKPLFAGRIGSPIMSQSQGWGDGYYRGYSEGYSKGGNNIKQKSAKKYTLPKIFSGLRRE